MLSKSAKFYRENKSSRDKKKAYDSKLNATKPQTDKRVALNKYNRESQAKGQTKKNDKLDAAHKGNKIVGFQAQSKNRGSTGASKGDRNARGKK